MPFQGCGRRCVYCDQRTITGAGDASLSLENVAKTLASRDEAVELCFFGGSFARQSRKKMVAYLETIHLAPAGSKITFSSYPGDFVGSEGAERIELLKGYPIATIELGVPSLDSGVLRACGRDDDIEEIVSAICALREAGFHLGIQIMIGLPGQVYGSALADLQQLAKLKGRERWDLRIYPCLVLQNTELQGLYEGGLFSPLPLEEAVLEAGELLLEAEKLCFTVVRVGLLESASLKKSVVAGPYHPAFGELAYAEKTARRLCSETPQGPWEIPEKTLSQLLGHRAGGLKRMAALSSLSLDETKKRIKRTDRENKLHPM